MRAKPRLVSTLVVLSSVILAALGNLFGNPVTDLLVGILPSGWRANALLLFGLVTLAVGAVSARFSWLQQSMRERDPRRRSLTRQRAAVVMIVVDEVLAAVGGVLSNVAAESLPAGLKPYTLPLFLLVIAGAIALGVRVYRRELAPREVATNRTKFLTKLQTRYSRQREDALRGAALIALALQEEPVRVSRPALSAGMLADGQTLADARVLPTGTGIIGAYDKADGQMLILGVPGAGKTTLLVELGLELVRRARSNGKLPLPVICNLSTWAINRQPLDMWLVEDLVETYQVQRSVAQGWVVGAEILPLLDGLDEVDAAHRPACVAAINTFHQDTAHAQLPLVVCSRIEEFCAQGVPLALRRAVVVQPLTGEQIQAYLASGGPKLAGLLAAVEMNEDLREVLRTPLMLRVVALTYEGLPREGIPSVGEHDAWMQQLFGEYVERMLKRRRRLEPGAADSLEETDQLEYPPKEVEQYLAWLAGQMRAHGLVELYLERLQPDWLPNTCMRQRYRRTVTLVDGLFFVLFFVLVGGLVGGLSGGLSGDLIGGLVGGLVNGLAIGLLIGLLAVLGGRQSVTHEKITLMAALHWSWRRGLGGGLFGLFTGLPIGLFFGLLIGQFIWLVVGLDLVLGVVLLFGLLLGLSNKQVNEQDYRTPNEGTLSSVRIGLVVVLVIVLLFVLVDGLVGVLVGRLSGVLVVGLLVGLLVGLFFGLAFGGGAALYHATLRWVIRRERLVPPHLVRFLNYAADHVLLQRVGGGYRFVHILLRDYFADLSPQRPEGRGKA